MFDVIQTSSEDKQSQSFYSDHQDPREMRAILTRMPWLAASVMSLDIIITVYRHA